MRSSAPNASVSRAFFASTLAVAAVATFAIGFLHCGGDDATTSTKPSSNKDSGGSLAIGATCTQDTECTSGACELMIDGTKHVCAAAPCTSDCQGIDSTGACVAFADNSETATCKGSCSSYGTSGVNKCCSGACSCTAGTCQ